MVASSPTAASPAAVRSPRARAIPRASAPKRVPSRRGAAAPSSPAPAPAAPCMTRRKPLDVGVTLRYEDLGEVAKRDHADHDHTPILETSIMHQQVSTRGFIATVQCKASPAVIAAAFNVDVALVRDVWLDGVPIPPVLRPSPPDRTMLRWRPSMPMSIPGASHDALPVDDAFPVDAPARERMPPPLQRAFDQNRRDIAQLIKKLDALFKRTGAPNAVQHPPARPLASRCGFSATARHEHLELRCEGLSIAKTRPGLYKTALGATPMRAPARHFYFEVLVISDAGAGGVCIGVAPPDTPLNKLLGSDRRSAGMHSSGQLVRGGGIFVTYGKQYHSGDRIGCLVSFSFCSRSTGAIQPPASMAGSYGAFATGILRHAVHDAVELTFFVNGARQATVREPLWRDVAEHDRVLYPAVSLYRDGSKATLQCCEADWHADKIFLLEHPDAIHSVCGN